MSTPEREIRDEPSLQDEFDQAVEHNEEQSSEPSSEPPSEPSSEPPSEPVTDLKVPYPFSKEPTSWDTDKNELVYLSELVADTYTSDSQESHTLYDSPTTGSPLARIVDGGDHLVLTIRGSHDMIDFYRDMNLTKTNIGEYFPINEAYDGATSRGFLDFAKDVHAAVYADLTQLLSTTNKQLIIAGHSLGCAGALIIHLLLLSTGHANRVELNVLFGAPRILYHTEVFDALMRENILRVCNESDPITFLPPKVLGMVHVGKSIILSTSGYQLYPYGDYMRDMDYMNQLFEAGRSQLSGFVLKSMLSTVVPEVMLAAILTPSAISQEYAKIRNMYTQHTMATYKVYLQDVLPEDLEVLEVSHEEAQDLFGQQLQSHVREMDFNRIDKPSTAAAAATAATAPADADALPPAPAPPAATADADALPPAAAAVPPSVIPPEIIGFYLYRDGEDIQNKIMLFKDG